MMDDDDLFVSPTTNEPMAFEFQSDLSDDDDDPVDDTFPSETPPLVSSDQTQDLPDRDPAQDPPLQTEPESESIQEQIEAQIAATTEAIEVGDVSDMLVAPTSPSASVVENGVSSDTSERTANGNSTGESNPSKTNNIEIQLPWMSPTKRAEFVHVEVVDKGYVAPNEVRKLRQNIHCEPGQENYWGEIRDLCIFRKSIYRIFEFQASQIQADLSCVLWMVVPTVYRLVRQLTAGPLVLQFWEAHFDDHASEESMVTKW